MATGKLTGKPFQKGNPGRRPGSKNKRGKEVRELARRIVEDKDYIKSLTERVKSGKAAHMETLLFHYAYGKPAETIEIGENAATALADLVRRATGSNG